MTGRGMGYCTGFDAPGYGLGLGRGRGYGGRGWRHWYYATGMPGWARASFTPAMPYGPHWQPMSKEQETLLLKSQAEALKHELDAIAKRLEELEKAG